MAQQYPFSVDDLGTVTHVLDRFLDEQDKDPPVEAAKQEVDEAVDNLDRDDIREIFEDDSIRLAQNDSGVAIVTGVTVRGDPPGHLDGFIADGGVAVSNPVGETRPIQPSGGSEDDFTDFDDISEARADALSEAGFSNFEDVHTATVDDIASIDGFRDTLAEKVKNEASRRLDPVEQTAASAFREQKAFEERGAIEDSVDDLKTEASNVSKSIGPVTDERYYALPVHEDIDHPYIEDAEDYDNLKTRELITGEEDIQFISRLIAENNHTVVLEGHAGIGKNYLLDNLFANTNWPSFRINIDPSMLSKDLLGVHKIGKDRKVVWEPGPVPKCVQNGWALIVDEPNLAREGVMMCLQQMSEKDGKLHVKGENSVIEPHPSFRAVFTQNPPTAEYRSTSELNSAFTSRLWTVKMPYLEPAEESDLIYNIVNDDRERLTRSDCSNLVELANRFRDQEKNPDLPRLTTRDLEKVATAADGPGDIESATKLTIRGCLGPRDNQEAAMNIIHDTM